MKAICEFQKILTTLGIAVSLLGTAVAQTTVPTAQATSAGSPMIYPAQGQTQAQMEKDKAECYDWAKQQSGYDPLAAGLQTQPYPGTQQLPPQQAMPSSQPRGGVVRGGAGGAAAGAAIGAIAGDAGKGAAIGAASGGAVGGIRQRRAGNAQAQAQQAAIDQQAAQQQAAVQQQQTADQQRIGAYKRAFEACMEGKGYTVKW